MAIITILGNSAAVPAKNRKLSAHLLELDGHSMLFDCGEGTQFQLINFRKKIHKISHIFITHLHGDHFYGLAGLLSTMSMLNRSKPIDIFGPQGLQDYLEALEAIASSGHSFDVNVHIVNTDNKSKIFENNDYSIYAFPLLHSVETYGYIYQQKVLKPNIKKSFIKDRNIPIEWFNRIKNGEDFIDEVGNVFANKDITERLKSPKSYAYCTDTAYFEQLSNYVQDVDLLYHESTFLQSNNEDAIAKMHSTASDAANIAKLAKVDRLIIGHFSARYFDLSDFDKEAKTIFTNTIVATEGLQIEF